MAERDVGATVVIPPQATAVPGPTAATAATEPTQRDQHIQSIAERGRLGWRRQTEYGKRSKAETAIGGGVLNRMIDQARPNSVRVA